MEYIHTYVCYYMGYIYKYNISYIFYINTGNMIFANTGNFIFISGFLNWIPISPGLPAMISTFQDSLE